MSRFSALSPDMLETLSASLDGGLSPADEAALQSSLRADDSLRAALQELSEIRAGLGMLPRIRVPRNFTLTPEMVGRRPAKAAYPRLRLATALAALGFVLAFGLDTYALRFAALPAALQTSAPAEEVQAQPPPEAAAEMLLDSAAAPAALPPLAEAEAEAERSAVDSLATATAAATIEPSLKAGAVGQAAGLEATAPAAPPAAPEAEDEGQEADATFANALESVPQPEAPARGSGWVARPLRLIGGALALLGVILGVLTVRARRIV
ncbi:MAG: hypothetical protein MUO23_03505 [Anaerolineales bacterium]|nr:hypothetical protein [Anaerolineales bacterium]